MPVTTKAPSATQVYVMILIGIASMLITFSLLFNSAHKLVNKNFKPEDSVWVTYEKNKVGDTSIKVIQTQSQKAFTKEKLLFNNNPNFFVWIVFITLMVAVASSLMPILFLSVKDIFRNFIF